MIIISFAYAFIRIKIVTIFVSETENIIQSDEMLLFSLAFLKDLMDSTVHWKIDWR